MALPTCPSCGQSVLDDDVEECPFCNASMSSDAKPAKPKETAPTPKKTSVAKQPPPKPQAKSSPEKPPVHRKKTASAPVPQQTSSSDSPGIPLANFRTKTNRFQIICPMCDTKGFAPKSASGREVRCLNPDCMVPLFNAPRLKVEKEEEAPPPRSMMPIISGSVVLLAIAGVAVWFFVFKKESPKPNPGKVPNNQQVVDKKPPTGEGTNGDQKEKDGNPTPKIDRPEIKYPSFAEIQETASIQIVLAAEEVSGNRSKPYCRWQTAEAFIDMGELKAAQQQIDQLGRVKPNIPFYKVIPLAKLGRAKMKRKDFAPETFNEVKALASEIPLLGEEAFQANVELAAFYIANNDEAGAMELIEQKQENQPTGRFVADLLQTRTIGEGDFNAVVNRSPIQPLHQPQWSAVAFLLTVQGKFDTAVRWSLKHSNPIVQTESLALCCETQAYLSIKQNSPQLIDKLKAILKKTKSATQAYVLARVALQLHDAGDQEQAKQVLEEAKQLLAKIKIPAAPSRPDMQTIYEGVFPKTTNLKITASAFAEAARVEAVFAHPKKSWELLEQALSTARAMTPSPVVCRNLVAELKQFGDSHFRSELKRLLDLNTNDQTRLALNDYRKHCRQLATDANQRFQLQAELLSHASAWQGLSPYIWQEVRQRISADVEQREPYDGTSLGTALSVQFDETKDKTILDEIKSLLKKPTAKPDGYLLLQQQASKLVQQGKLNDAAELLESSRRVNKYPKVRLSLQIACQLVKQNKLKEAVQFVRAFDNPIVRELCFRTISSLATRSDKGQPFWEICKDIKLPPTERVAFYRGMIAGITAKDLLHKK